MVLQGVWRLILREGADGRMRMGVLSGMFGVGKTREAIGLELEKMQRRPRMD